MTRRIFVREIQQLVAAEYRLPVRVMTSRRTDSEVLWPRFVAIYLASELTANSLAEIGRRFGGRDHSTVRNAVQRVAARRRLDREFDSRIWWLLAVLRADRKAVPSEALQPAFLHGPLFDLVECVSA